MADGSRWQSLLLVDEIMVTWSKTEQRAKWKELRTQKRWCEVRGDGGQKKEPSNLPPITVLSC